MLIGHYRNCPIPLGEVTATVGWVLMDRAKKWAQRPMVAVRMHDGVYRTVSWEDGIRSVASLVSFFQEQGVGRGDRVAVLSQNSREMLLWELAAASMGAISVSIFAGYDLESIDYILRHAEPRALFVDGKQQLENVEESGASKRIPLIVTKEESAYVSFQSCLKSVSLGLLDKFVSMVKPDDPCFLQYTSGTSGDPKGVVLTNRNIMSQQQALSLLWNISTDSRFLAHLPWHHSFGGLFERFSALYNGAVLYLDDSYGKDVERLLDNMSHVKPTQFFSVPRIHRALVHEAQLNPDTRDILCHPELQFVFTAAAPLPKEIGAYFKAQNVRVMEGWGLTETSPCVTLTPLGKERVHSYVGEPIPGCEILTNEENEILVRGPNVMAGYFRDPERTSDVMDGYGWFNTGDIGEITDYGLRLIGRIDGQFKLSNGEKVSSTLVESALTSPSKWVQHAVALGAGEDYVAALIFPNFRNLESWAKEHGKPYSNKLELAGDEEVQDLISGEITGNMADFGSKVMTVRGFAIIPEELSMERGELTPSMKVIRHRVISKYKEWREAIYQESGHIDKKRYVVKVEEYDAFTW